ncbi:MAG: ABC transporter substrate-binding protein [Candidatus Hodarchaeota archaeon]
MNKSKLLFGLMILSLISMQTRSSSHYPLITNYQEGGTTSIVNISSKIQQIPDVLRMGEFNFYGNPIDLDPLFRMNTLSHSLMYEPLIEYDFEHNQIVPVLAYQWVVTNDSKHWTFYLREGIIFHDGSMFNAHAVKFSFERSINITGRRSLWAYAGMPLDSVEIVNEFQVIFHFYEPYAPFMHREAQIFFILSPNSFEGANLTSPIGTGPYKINLEQSNSTFLHFNRFDQYHGGLAPFKEIHYTFYPLGEGDRYGTDIEEHKLDSTVWGGPYSHDPYWNTTYNKGVKVADRAHFNLNNTYLANKNVRKALNYALDNKAFADEFSDFAHPSRSILPPGNLGHDPSIEGYPYNPEIANNLLDEEGYTRGRDGIRFHLRMIGVKSWGWIMEFIAASFGEIGVICHLEVIDTLEEWETRWKQGDYDLTLLTTLGYDSSLTYSLLHSKGIHNTGGYENKTMDYLTGKGQETPVRQERTYYYQLVQRLAQEECPYLLLEYYPVSYHRAQHLTPYFYLSGKIRFIFNCTSSSSRKSIDYSQNLKIDTVKIADLRILTDIKVADQAIYFPITDAIIVNPAIQPLEVTMKMSHQLSTFLPTQNALGKYYQIRTDNEDLYYRFRSYYDPEEVKTKSFDQLALYEYDDEEEMWRKLDTISANTSLSYVEIELKGGDKLLRLGESIEGVVQLTYNLFPFISIFTILMVVIISVTIAKNQKVAKYVKTKYG